MEGLMCLTEHEFYTEYEDLILNQDLTAALVFMEQDDSESDRLILTLQEREEDFKIPVYILESEDAKDVIADFIPNSHLPRVVIYQGGEEVYRSGSDFDDIVDEILEYEN